ncbi:protein KilA [Bacillus phage pW4]|uniref:Protein KilA n=1 Tax=Bacillus phage pW4 TaxID=2500560 RepID=A0A3T0II53_9CAUD|nr:anti-repressor Ant [Bacillus phage pW4]AZU99109.1 protein KilA [Bacillus phage pW4]
MAQVFGKHHKNVMVAIKNLLTELHDLGDKEGMLNFKPTQYTQTQNGQVYNKYNLTKDGLTMLVMGFTGKEALKFKTMYIKEFNKMEQELKNRDLNSYMIDDPIARAERWIKEQQEKQLLLVQNKELSEKIIEAKPKLEMYDAWLDVDGHCSIGEFARRVGLGRNTMFEKLRQMKILMNKGVNKNMPYQRFMKYFKIIDSMKGDKAYRVTVLNKEGCVWLHKKLQQEKEKLEPLKEKYDDNLEVTYNNNAEITQIEVGNKPTEWVKQPEEDDYVKDQKIDL